MVIAAAIFIASVILLTQLPRSFIPEIGEPTINVTVELGRTSMPIKEVLDLQSGAVVELDRIAGEPVDIFINDRLLAQGEVVVIDDKFGVRVTELTGKKES